MVQRRPGLPRRSGLLGEQPCSAVGPCITLNSGFRPIVHFLERRTALSETVPSTYQAMITCQRHKEANIRAIIMRLVGDEPNATFRGLSVRDASDLQQVIIQADVFTPRRNDAFMEI